MIKPGRFARLPFSVFPIAAILVAGACKDKKPDPEGPYGRQVAEAIPAIERAVGLKFKTPPKIESRSKPQVREFVAKQITDSVASREFAGITAAYKRFGMIPDSLNLQKFLIDLLEEQIVGYYDPKTKVLYVVSDAPKEAVGITITHELVHALQDQYISLDSTQQIVGQNDRQSAAQAVFEGQAVYEQIAAMTQGSGMAMNMPGGWDRIREMIRENQSSMPVFARAPLVIQETLIFPYLSGAEFVRNFKDRSPGKSVYDDMPVSTEQVMHPRSYFGTRDAPTTVTLPPLVGVSPVYENTLGEFETKLFLYQHLEDQNEATRGATGWDGDRYALFRTARGEGIAWVTVWDSPAEAAEFYELLGRIAVERYAATTSATAGATSRLFAGSGRSVLVSSQDIGGRPTVLWVDSPQGASTSVVNLGGVTLKQ
jgi:hypothetical protein